MMDLTLTADGFIVNAAYCKIVAEELGCFSAGIGKNTRRRGKIYENKYRRRKIGSFLCEEYVVLCMKVGKLD